jgi:polar amino acid transport system substrate-binding protein
MSNLNASVRYNLRYFLFLFICFLQESEAQESLDEIVINVVTEDSYPYQYLDDARVKGPASALVKRVLEEAGFDYRQNVLPWARAYSYAQTKPNTLIYSIARTSERESKFKWVGHLTLLNYYLVGLSSLKLSPPVMLNSLKEMNIGTIRNSANHIYLTSQGFKYLHLLTSSEQIVKMLKLGRIDLFPTDYATFQLSCLHLMLDCREIVPIYRLEETSTSLYMAFSLQTDDRIVNKVRAAYQKVMKSYARSYTSFLSDDH